MVETPMFVVVYKLYLYKIFYYFNFVKLLLFPVSRLTIAFSFHLSPDAWLISLASMQCRATIFAKDGSIREVVTSGPQKMGQSIPTLQPPHPVARH